METPYPIFPETIPNGLDLRSGHYAGSFARTRKELKEVQRLRFEVFNLELGEGLDSSFQTRMDIDPYDDQCHHLIIRDTRTGELVGTYRMQTRRMAESGRGFYSDSEFHLDQFPDDVLTQSMELGRACISAAHRNGRVLFLLWRGLLSYLRMSGLRYLFGCCSITSQNPADGWAMFERLKRAEYLHPEHLLTPREGYICEEKPFDEEIVLEVEMPRLMRLYIDYGTLISSEPAIDREFKTIDFLVLFDNHHFPEKMAKIFKGAVSE
jgi:putative hemolysin